MLGAGAYINILAEGEDARIQETYGAKFDRLQMIKNKYDLEQCLPPEREY
jgi:hypothetical protein